MTDTITSALVDKEITFLSKNTSDLVKWTGVLAAIVNYNIATQFGDVVSYNAAVQKADPTVGDVSTLNFFIVTLASGTGTTSSQIFAEEWITAGSFAVINAANIININVYDTTTSDPTNLLALLKSNGYTASVVSITMP